MTETVRVDLARRSYYIRIAPDLLSNASAHIGPLLPRPFTVIVTDETVAELHLETLPVGLAEAGIAATAIVLPPDSSAGHLSPKDKPSSCEKCRAPMN